MCPDFLGFHNRIDALTAPVIYMYESNCNSKEKLVHCIKSKLQILLYVAYQYILIQDVELVFVTYLSLFLFHELHYFFFFLMTDQFFINVILFYCYTFIRSCDTWHVVENFLSFHLRYYDFIDQLNCMKLKQK